jgi:uncharacterized protein (DUF433 family)
MSERDACPELRAPATPTTSRAPRILDTVGEIMPSKPAVVHRHPDIMSGTPVFVGTRVPVQALFDYLENGDTLAEFLRQFPSVTRAQALQRSSWRRKAS